MMGGVSETIDRSARVSTLELFFDLVFVFTITQLTGVLVAGGDAASALQVVVMLAVIWWMYDGYAWLTNAIATDSALPAPPPRWHGRRSSSLRSPCRAPTRRGPRLRAGLRVVVLLHAGMYVQGNLGLGGRGDPPYRSVQSRGCGARAARRDLGGDRSDLLWARQRRSLWLTPWFTSTEGFVIAPAHFVERHGLVIIVALGESIVVDRRGRRRRPARSSGSAVVACSRWR